MRPQDCGDAKLPDMNGHSVLVSGRSAELCNGEQSVGSHIYHGGSSLVTTPSQSGFCRAGGTEIGDTHSDTASEQRAHHLVVQFHHAMPILCNSF